MLVIALTALGLGIRRILRRKGDKPKIDFCSTKRFLRSKQSP